MRATLGSLTTPLSLSRSSSLRTYLSTPRRPKRESSPPHYDRIANAIWLFNSARPALTELTPATPHAQLAAPLNPTNGFTVNMSVDLKPFTTTRTLLEISNVVRVTLRQHDQRIAT